MRATRLEGFTLIEVLLVVLLLALATGTLTTSLSGSNDLAALRLDEGSLRGLDRRARLLARTAGPVILAPSEDGRSLVLEALHDGTLLARHALARGATVELVAEVAGPALVVDRFGRSPDYEVILRRAGSARTWRVCGSTGWAGEAADVPRDGPGEGGQE